jgi:hypothetical protein
MLMVKALLRAGKKAKKAVKKAKRGTQDLFADRFVSQLDEGQAPSRGTLDVEAGRAGRVNVGRSSMPTMKDALSMGSRKRAKLVAKLENLEEKGDITKTQKTMLNRLNALSRQADEARTSAAAKTRRDKAAKDRGVSLAGMEGKITVGTKPRLKDSDMMVGNTTNGITKDGEIIGNPTDNQIAAVVRNFEARKRLSTDAKRNLAKLKRMSKRQRQDRAISRLNRNIKDTGPDRKNKGGLMKSVHTDMRKSGLFK